MNKLIVLGKIYKNGSLATSKNGKSYIGFTIIDSRKTIEESIGYVFNDKNLLNKNNIFKKYSN